VVNVNIRVPSDIIHKSFAVKTKIEEEVDNYEAKYRGRELPGFINYKTFEGLVRNQIKLLEEPALNTLKTVSGLCFFINIYIFILCFYSFFLIF